MHSSSFRGQASERVKMTSNGTLDSDWDHGESKGEEGFGAGYVVASKEGAGSRDHSTARQPEEGGGAGLR